MGFSGDRFANSGGDGDRERGAPGSEDAYARGGTPTEDVSDQLAEADGGATNPPGDAIAIAQRAAEEHRDRYMRLAAEYDNYRKRMARERQEAHWRGQADMVKGMIEALDDLARFAHVDPDSVDARTVVEGAAMVEKKLTKTLAGHGLEIINPQDQAFDPALHEAVGTEPALSREDDHLVARVYQPGYVFNGQLLRPARVVVKQWNG